MYSSNLKGFILAVVSSAFIGSSFIIKKKGLRKAGVNGPRAGSGGYGYLLEPLWWVGMITMIVGEIANFVAYIYAPAVLVTPLGALSIIVSAILAHFILKEKLQKMGMLGCLLCIVGSTVIVLHAPEERSINSVEEIWELATQPGNEHKSHWYCDKANIGGHKSGEILSNLDLCNGCNYLYHHSVKLSEHGKHFQIIANLYKALTWLQALDTFNTAIVSPIYYALFTSFTILASAIMFKDYSGQSASSIASELCGFVTVLSGTAVLHSTRDPDTPLITGISRIRTDEQTCFKLEHLLPKSECIIFPKCVMEWDLRTILVESWKIYYREEHKRVESEFS
ncbi:Magnesium transporter NIPA - like 1 [Theobroma cacao]|nr:Magnesium transporter NIPA - like 1 [Theobroma cacao]